jgi:metal-responsive CopG/Arc/MetJ family transcriptional regulator
MKTKKELSISLTNELLIYIKNNFSNRSKFIEYCIKQELLKVEKFKKNIETWE